MKTMRLALRNMKANWMFCLIVCIISTFLLSSFIFVSAYQLQIHERIEENKEKVMNKVFLKTNEKNEFMNDEDAESMHQQSYFYKKWDYFNVVKSVNVTYEEFQTYAASELVEDSYYQYNIHVEIHEDDVNGYKDDLTENGWGPMIMIYASNDLGVNALGSQIDEPLEGRMPEQLNEVTLKKTEAEKYKLSIGDRFRIKEDHINYLGEQDGPSIESTLTIVGISEKATYTTIDTIEAYNKGFEEMYIANDGEVPYYVGYYVTNDVVFNLHDYNDVKKFINEVSQTNPDLAEILSYDTDAYQQLVTTLEMTNKDLNKSLLYISGISILLILIVSIYEYQKRKKDFNILELQGMTKKSIIQQLLVEKLYIVIVAIIASFILFILFAQPILDQILLQVKDSRIGVDIYENSYLYTDWMSNLTNISLYDSHLLNVNDMLIIPVNYKNISWIIFIIVGLLILVWSNIFVAIRVIRNKQLHLGRERI
ncbi:FtsX-like permease family protein [Breznakia pachnodae]|uniref:ABC3 transporter permease C-terminal domain-containing protein n=1 Tax=Breznakia pachnodae TaxID=265178 RepID=A0ABU0E6M2_9FIRM|nr:FtsX-like permease family protein [Breznakia pachnodae]MDQ0362359.1 hypothetical protein [Breznakia pachnodae]